MKLREKIEHKLKRCVYCWGVERLTVDHKLAISRGGSNEKNNLQWACRRCNGYKGDMKHLIFKKLIKACYQIRKERIDRQQKVKLKEKI